MSKVGCLWHALACLPDCVCVCVCVCLSVFLPAFLSVCLSACLSAFLPVCLSACLSGSPFQPNGESFHCFRANHIPPYHGRKGGAMARAGYTETVTSPSWSTSGYQQCRDSRNEGAMQTRMGTVQKRQSVPQGRSELKLRRDWESAVSGVWHRRSVKLHWRQGETGRREQRRDRR